MTDLRLECDLLVLGSGMAGLSAAAWAAERGARVAVVEKAAAIGGSAALSGGMLWTATSPRRMRLHGGGQEALGQVVLENYPVALQWLRARDIAISDAMSSLHGRGYQVDIIAHLRGCAAIVEQAGGQIALETSTEALLTDDHGRVVGARTSHRDGDIDIVAPWTLLATGGYQGSPEMRAAYIHPNALQMRLRSNLTSCGDGLRLAMAVGAAAPAANPGFYGHLVSETPDWGDPRLFTLLSQYHSDHTLLLNEEGVRFCDESAGDHANSYHTLIQTNARALCFWDTRIHAQQATQPIVAAAPPIDRMEVALRYGGKGAVAASLADVASFAAAQGFDGARVRQSIEDYNRRSRDAWETLSPERAENSGPLEAPPYYALIVHPAITHTHGGLRIDPQARVLKADGAPVGGLLAAGGDAGDVFGLGYAGGLAMGIAFGIEAARTAGFRRELA